MTSLPTISEEDGALTVTFSDSPILNAVLQVVGTDLRNGEQFFALQNGRLVQVRIGELLRVNADGSRCYRVVN